MFARGGIGVAPSADRERSARQPQQQADGTGFAEHFQHDLVRMQRRAFAPCRALPGCGITARKCEAEPTRADAIDGVRARHTRRRAPDPAASRQRRIDIGLLAAGGIHRALDPFAHRGNGQAEDQEGHRAEREHARQPFHTQNAPAGEQQHQPIGQPGSARTGQHDHHAHQRRRHQPSSDAEPPGRGVERERREAGQDQTELEIAWTEDATEPVQRGDLVGAAHRFVADRLFECIDAEEQRAGADQCLRECVEGPHRHDDRQSAERCPSSTRIGHGGRGQPQERQVAQVRRGFAEGTRGTGGVKR